MTLRKKATIPLYLSCDSSYLVGNKEYCGIWYYTVESDEVKLLKSTDCGSLCGVFSEGKGNYSISELARVAAYAAANGDQKVISYFGLNTEKQHWYDNKEDMMKYYQARIQSWLENKLSGRRVQAQKELEDRLTREISNITGIRADRLEAAAEAITIDTLEALNKKVAALLDAAVERTKGNGRATVKPQDL